MSQQATQLNKQSKLQDPSYYHREYSNDLGNKETTQSNPYQRITLASIPFLSLYKPFGFAVSLGMGAVRVITELSELRTLTQNGTQQEIFNQAIQTMISVAALAGTILAHPAGMLMTTGQDIIVDCMHLIHDLNDENYTKALERSASIVNNALYLGLFFSSSLQLSIASLSIQIALGLYHSSLEFRNGHWIEGSSHLLMSAMRVNQASGQIQELQAKYKLATAQRTLENNTLVEMTQNECALDVAKQGDLHSEKISTVNSTDELTTILIEYGNNPKGYSAIAWATHLGHEDVVKKLISYGIDHKKAGVPGIGNLLDIALLNKHLDLADYFVKNGINSCNQMHHFQEENNFKVWEFFEKNRLLDGCKDTNWLARCLQKKGSISGIKFLVENGADCSSRVNLHPYNKHMKPGKDLPGILTVAYDSGQFQPEFVKFLVDHGAPINTNLELQTSWDPFFLVISAAVWSKNKEEMEKWNTLTKYFIDLGAKWPNDGANHSGRISFVSTAMHYQNLDVILLMSKVCDCLEYSSILIPNPDHQANNPKTYLLTPLQYAIFHNKSDDAKKLLEHGANPNNIGVHPNYLPHHIFPKTPLSIAIQNKSPDIVKLLLGYGASLN